MTKDSILKLLREIAEVEGGDVSMRRFIAMSGIKEKQILGVHWPTWNDAKREAGLETQAFARERLQDDSLIPAIARLMSTLGRWPTENELRLAKKQDSKVPSTKVFRRLLNDRNFLRKLHTHCEAIPNEEGLLSAISDKLRDSLLEDSISVTTVGYVYMMRSGRRYKIGFTTSPSRRHREVRLDLPDRTDLVHSIETDDPRGIEAYWHNRFANQRVRDTEFFELSAADVAAFKKRKFQ